MNVHDKGDQVRLAVAFTDAAGAAADPSSVTLKYRKPDGSITTIAYGSLTHPAVGSFYADVVVDQAGTWSYRFESSGTYVGAEEESFRVRSSRLSPTDP